MILSPNLKGALFMAISMAGFTFNDAIVKHVSAAMNMGQVMLVRGLFATLLIGALAWNAGALRSLGAVANPMVAMRVFGEVGGTVTFLIALAHIPLANTSAILQALPLAVTMGAALFLGEPVGWRRWTAIAAGFAGMLTVLRPGFEGFDTYALLVCGTVVFAAIRDLATRQVPSEIPSLLLSTLTALAVSITGVFLIGPLGGWRALTPMATGQLFAAACLILFGYHFIIMAMRTGEISFIAPFRYTSLLWAILLGYLVFGDVPDLFMIAGSTIIVASGLYTIYREHVVARKTPVATATAPGMAPDGL